MLCLMMQSRKTDISGGPGSGKCYIGRKLSALYDGYSARFIDDKNTEKMRTLICIASFLL
jgi:hypothetical protein